MSEPPAPTTHSTEFPEGYGDFTIHSNDGVLLHFPSFLLSHASPVFKDMFQLGENSQSQNAITLAEDHETLEHLLCHIDPAKELPDFCWDGIMSLLAAADKYQIKGVFKWFEREVAVELAKSPSLAIAQPVLCLNLATRYGLPMTTALALRQLMKYSISDIIKDPHHRHISFEPLSLLRANRINQLNTLIFDMERASMKDNTNCGIHGISIRGWVISAIRGIALEPSWSALERAIQSSRAPGCSCRWFSPTAEWKIKALALEAELPTL